MEELVSSYRFTAHCGALFLSALIALIVACFAWRRRKAPGAVFLALLGLAAAQWALAIAFETAATTVSLKLLWSQIAYLGTTCTPLFFFLFALAYSQQWQFLTRRHIALFSIVPALTMVAAATNERHGWLWPNISIQPDSNIAIYAHGPWFWLFIGYSYILLTAGVIVLLATSLRLSGFHRPQIGALLIGSALPIVGNAIYVSGLSPIPGLDWTPVSFALSGLVLAWGIFKYQTLDLVPIARDALVDTMRDGLLVLDMQGRILDLNPAMQSAIGLRAAQVIGQPVAQALASWKELCNSWQTDTETRLEAGMGEGEARRYYDVHLLPLHDRRGRRAGQLAVLHDITERKRLEIERTRLISELQDALAQVKTLSGILPICANCKRIRDAQGQWQPVEVYVRDHSQANFSHGLCPDCARKLYPEFYRPEDSTA